MNLPHSDPSRLGSFCAPRYPPLRFGLDSFGNLCTTLQGSQLKPESRSNPAGHVFLAYHTANTGGRSGTARSSERTKGRSYANFRGRGTFSRRVLVIHPKASEKSIIRNHEALERPVQHHWRGIPAHAFGAHSPDAITRPITRRSKHHDSLAHPVTPLFHSPRRTVPSGEPYLCI